jgi:hypothetical protein
MFSLGRLEYQNRCGDKIQFDDRKNASYHANLLSYRSKVPPVNILGHRMSAKNFSFLLVFIFYCCGRIHCSIYKSSYNILNI